MKEDAALAVLRLSGKDASCDQILPYVEVLEALTKSKDMRHNCWKSMMYCYVKGKQQDKLVLIASKVMLDPTTPAEMRTESQLILVKSNIQAGKTDSSLVQLKTIYSKDNNRFAAEAKYLEAELLFTTDSLEACKNSCYAILDEFNGYDLWVGKALILLGDAFKKEGDLLNAKATWNGVIENFEMPELVNEAKLKLKELETSTTGSGGITPPKPEQK
jgi:predicted negative regulator of RcsB-dependent stress response